MPKHRDLLLTEEQQEELRDLRDHDPLPYMRERAGALLKIGQGQRPAHVARGSLLRPREPDTLYRWMDRYQQQGAAGLRVRPGRGRKPAFSPCV